jgi:4'-phosphopantetheinyl transferase
MPGALDCWILGEDPGAVALPAPAAFLTPSELDRLAAMTDGKRALQFRYSRYRLKQVLGSCLGTAPGAIAFELNENGKPFLPGSPLEFNLSHTDGWLAIAVSRTRSVGVDLEKRRSVSHLERIARKFFAAGELALLDACQGVDSKESLFFRLWSAKEALIKGMGGGVFRDVLDTELELAASGALAPRRLPGERPSEWSLTELEVAPGVVGMLASGPKAGSADRSGR